MGRYCGDLRAALCCGAPKNAPRTSHHDGGIMDRDTLLAFAAFAHKHNIHHSRQWTAHIVGFAQWLDTREARNVESDVLMAGVDGQGVSLTQASCLPAVVEAQVTLYWGK